jgi:hypothetical protein
MASTTIESGKTAETTNVEKTQSPGGLKGLDLKLKEKYESFWLYHPGHPSRLPQHIVARGLIMGSTIGFLGAVPYAMIKKKGIQSIGRITLRGTTIGCVLLAAAAAERMIHLDMEGIADRSYRIAHNWGQTKWDYFTLDGALVGAVLLRRSMGGALPAAAVGAALGSLAWMMSIPLLR